MKGLMGYSGMRKSQRWLKQRASFVRTAQGAAFPGWAVISGLMFAVAISSGPGFPQMLPQAPAPSPDASPRVDFSSASRALWFTVPYRVPFVKPSRDDDSPLVDSLIHNDKLDLTLQNAIELAIQNNFDVELQRYDRLFAKTEILRAQGGGQLRGVPTTVTELPSGEGGPGEPLLTAVGGYTPVLQLPSSASDLATIVSTQTDLSILSSTPYSPGSAVPQFDPAVAANIALTQFDYPQSTSFSTGSNYYSSHSVGGAIGYTQGFATGTILSATFSANRLNEASTRLNLDPFITGALNVSITQPLLQGFGIHVTRRFIHIAENEDRIAEAVFDQQLINTISDTTRLYWDLVSLQQDLEVKKESLAAAERLYQDTKNEVERGTQAPVDMTSALAQVASNRQAYINAQGMVLQQELLLKEVLTRKGVSDPSLAEARIDAVTIIESPTSDVGATLQSLIDQAMKLRPDFALALQQEDSSRLSLKGSKNALLPDLAIVASMQNNGGEGTLNPALASTTGGLTSMPPQNLLGGFGVVVDQVFSRSYPDYAVGVSLNIPVRNRIARADMARDELQYRQSQVQMDKLRSRVRLEVGNAYIALQQAAESYKAAVEARTLQEQALDVERAKFDAGVATAYELLQYQSSLAEAKSAVVTALGVYAKARTALQRAVGSTLSDNHISVNAAFENRTATEDNR